MQQLGKAVDVLRDPHYWTVPFCRTFLDRWDDQVFGDPQEGHRLAGIGLKLVARVEEQTGEDQPALRARALSISGSAWRVTGDLQKARTNYAAARELYRNLEEPLSEADLYRRRVFLHRDLQEWKEALTCANRAAKIFLAAGDKHSYGRVLVASATVFTRKGLPAQAIPLLSKGLANLDYDRSPPAFYAGVHNLTVALAQTPESSGELLDTALGWLREARRSAPQRGLGTKRYGYRKRSVPDAKLRFVLALILRRKGNRGSAIRFLEEAYEDLVDLDMPLDVVGVSLELGELYAEMGRWAKLEALASEAGRLLAPFPQLSRLSEAFREWQTAILARKQVAEIGAVCRRLLDRHSVGPGFLKSLPDGDFRRRLSEAINAALSGCQSLEELGKRLGPEGITVHHREVRGGRPAGIAFELEGRRLTGHQLGRPFRLSSLKYRLELERSAPR